MVSRSIIKAVITVVAIAVNIIGATIVTIGVDALPFYFVAMMLTFAAGILIGWDF